MHHLKELEKFPEALFTEAQNDAWKVWQSSNKKIYGNDADVEKRKHFWKNANDLIEDHNKQFDNGKQSFKVGHNKFSDFSPEEITKLLKGFDANLHIEKRKKSSFNVDTSNLPDAVDWREQGFVNPIQDQGKYGCCYAFSSCAAMEGQFFKKSGYLVKLSEQNLIDGTSKMGNNGDGGTMNNCFEYVRENGGIELNETYPYSGPVGTCKYKPENSAGFTLGDYTDIPEGDELALTAAVAFIGPISVGISASSQSFQLYESGIYFDSKCSRKPDHAVVIVGYGSEGYGKDYYIVRNSWGSDWGENGYIRIARNKRNFAGIAQMASFPVISENGDIYRDDDEKNQNYTLRISKSTGAKTSNITNDTKNNNLSISKSTGATLAKTETTSKKDVLKNDK